MKYLYTILTTLCLTVIFSLIRFEEVDVEFYDMSAHEITITPERQIMINITLYEFACEVFGKNNITGLNKEYIQNFYKDWKSTGLCLKQYKSLLKTRG